MDSLEFRAIQQARLPGASILVRSPGRVNLIGEHTDYNEGYVLPCAIDKALWMAFEATELDAEAVMLHSLLKDQKASFLLDNPKIITDSWIRFAQAVVLELRSKGFEIKGFKVLIGGDLPAGAGLSSSSALTVGLLFGLSELFRLEIAKPELARIAQAAEHRTGTRGGLMDQTTILFGKKDQVLLLDCRSLAFEYLPLALGDYTLLLLDSKVEHDLAATEYNLRRAECEEAVSMVRKKFETVRSLRDVSTQHLEEIRGAISQTALKRARFVLAENQRVLQSVEALQNSDLKTFGRLLLQSHAGLRDDYEVSTAELDLLVELVSQHPAGLGARMMGGGFGGCTLNLIKEQQAPHIIDQVLQTYFEKTGIVGTAHHVVFSDGISTVEA